MYVYMFVERTYAMNVAESRERVFMFIDFLQS